VFAVKIDRQGKRNESYTFGHQIANGLVARCNRHCPYIAGKPCSAQGPGDAALCRDMEIGELNVEELRLEPYGEWSEFADECIDPKPTLKGSNGLIADC
jgi:hypothetical protein